MASTLRSACARRTLAILSHRRCVTVAAYYANGERFHVRHATRRRTADRVPKVTSTNDHRHSPSTIDSLCTIPLLHYLFASMSLFLCVGFTRKDLHQHSFLFLFFLSLFHSFSCSLATWCAQAPLPRTTGNLTGAL